MKKTVFKFITKIFLICLIFWEKIQKFLYQLIGFLGYFGK